jgi:glycosyltransferase involved in cell wall biosynthesis
LFPRKNVKVLVEVFADLTRESVLAEHSLVLAGPRRRREAWLDSLLESNSEIVKELGYVAEEDLPALYSGASIFACRSLYKGFGIPVLEARACGTRIDMPELGRPAALAEALTS